MEKKNSGSSLWGSIGVAAYLGVILAGTVLISSIIVGLAIHM